MKGYCLLIAVLLFSKSIFAENWKLDKYIEVTPPEGLDITFQIYEDFDPTQKVIMGWTGEELNYVMTTDHQPGGLKTKKYWRGLLSESKKQSDNNKLAVIHEGEFSNQHGYDITFKIFTLMLDGEPQFHVYYLIKDDVNAYYVMAIPVDQENLQGAWEKSTQIMHSAKLIK